MVPIEIQNLEPVSIPDHDSFRVKERRLSGCPRDFSEGKPRHADPRNKPKMAPLKLAPGEVRIGSKIFPVLEEDNSNVKPLQNHKFFYLAPNHPQIKLLKIEAVNNIRQANGGPDHCRISVTGFTDAIEGRTFFARTSTTIAGTPTGYKLASSYRVGNEVFIDYLTQTFNPRQILAAVGRLWTVSQNRHPEVVWKESKPVKGYSNIDAHQIKEHDLFYRLYIKSRKNWVAEISRNLRRDQRAATDIRITPRGANLEVARQEVLHPESSFWPNVSVTLSQDTRLKMMGDKTSWNLATEFQITIKDRPKRYRGNLNNIAEHSLMVFNELITCLDVTPEGLTLD